MALSEPMSYYQFLTSPRVPAELILMAIQHLPFGNGKLIASLRCAHPRLWNLVKTYERSIIRHFKMRELPHAEADFPYDASPTFKWLTSCVERYDTVDDIMDALSSTQNCFPVARHNLSLVNAGLLLLYKVTSIDDHPAKLIMIKSLPLGPLTAIYLALHHATLTARYHGSGWMHQKTYGRFMDANQLSLRKDIEFCYAEAALDLGPSFVSNMILHHYTSDAETTLLNYYHMYGNLDWEWPCWGRGLGEFEPPRTQGPKMNKEFTRKSLFTTLLERMADSMESPLKDVRARIEQHTDMKDHSLAYLDMAGKARFMQGLDLEHTICTRS